MRWFASRGAPAIDRLLLVESGPRAEVQRLVPFLRESVCGERPIDLFTCMPGSPEGLGAEVRAWRSYDATGYSQRWRLLRALRRERHATAAIPCLSSPILATWKLVLAAFLPARILLVDPRPELIDLEPRRWRRVLRLALDHSGFGTREFARRIAHLLFVPIGLLILIPFAARVHLGRLIRATRMGPRPDGHE